MNTSIRGSEYLNSNEFDRDRLPGLLCDKDIRRLIKITPFAEGVKRDGVISYGLSSIGYDFRLGTKFKLFNHNYTGKINPKKVDENAFIDYETDQEIDIPPGGYLLGESVEELHIPRNIGVIVIGKSTYARVGCSINVTPGEPEWIGRWTIEIENAAPVPLTVFPNEGIMQCLFIRTVGSCDVSYADKKGKYNHATGLDLARVDKVDKPRFVRCVVCNGTGADGVTQQGNPLACLKCLGSGVV